MENFFINHRNVARSIDKKQINGADRKISDATLICKSMSVNDDSGKLYSWENALLDQNAVLNPCGVYANLMPNGFSLFLIKIDDFALYKKSPKETSILSATTEDIQFTIKTDGLIWDTLKGHRFKRTEGSNTKQWVDPESDRFIEWMKIPMSSTFEKLWGRIDNDLTPGTYTIEIHNGKGSQLNLRFPS